MDLKKLTQWAKEELALILEDIPELKKNAYLVYSSPYGQCNLTADRLEIYKSFPSFFTIDDNHKKIKQILQNKDEKNKELSGLLDSLLIADNTNIEFRFEKLNYELIDLLKRHPKVRQPERMMRRSWIRVRLISLNDQYLSDNNLC